ncbi:hypothetical protein IFM61606_02767 [Aspergillus udagawae]|nr:hypothetical protein IFM51744_03041 [Aspergillus udagawae]GFG22898.1 hypothetical protein IFM61606_02767 [Aspergillus udagawae]
MRGDALFPKGGNQFVRPTSSRLHHHHQKHESQLHPRGISHRHGNIDRYDPATFNLLNPQTYNWIFLSGYYTFQPALQELQIEKRKPQPHELASNEASDSRGKLGDQAVRPADQVALSEKPDEGGIEENVPAGAGTSNRIHSAEPSWSEVVQDISAWRQNFKARSQGTARCAIAGPGSYLFDGVELILNSVLPAVSHRRQRCRRICFTA